MSSSSNGEARERRVGERRSREERRLGERRKPERAVAGRRVLYVADRRQGDDRRTVQNAAYSPA
jgi:hypothetical protein